MLRIITIIIFTLYTNLSYSVLVKSQSLVSKQKDSQESVNQYLFYDIHTHPASLIESIQLEEIKQILKKREKDSSSQLDFFVEQPLSIIKRFDPNKRIVDLKSHSANIGLKNTHIREIEVRCASLAALFLIESTDTPCEFPPDIVFENSEQHYNAIELTYQDLMEEYNRTSYKLGPFLNTLKSCTIKKNNQQFKDTKRYLKELQKTAKNMHINPKESLLTQLQKPISISSRNALWNSISLLYGHLFNMNILRNMLKSTHKKHNCALISGYLHSQEISELLTHEYSTVIKSHSTGHNPYSNKEPKGLEIKELDIF